MMVVWIVIGLVFNVNALFGGGGLYPGGFIEKTIGLRALSLGGATVASSKLPFGVRVNPAANLFPKARFGFEAYYVFLPVDRRMGGVGISYDLKGDAAISLSFFNSTVTNISERDIDGNELGKISNAENLVTFSFCKRFGLNFSVGGNINYVQATLYKLSTYAVGLDIGVDLLMFNGKLELGGTYRNSGLTYSWNSSDIYEYGASFNESFPKVLELGFALRDSLFVPFELLGAISKRDGQSVRFKFGGEFGFFELLSLRCGFDGRTPTVGFSVFKDLKKFAAELGYAYLVSPIELPAAHSFGFILKF